MQNLIDPTLKSNRKPYRKFRRIARPVKIFEPPSTQLAYIHALKMSGSKTYITWLDILPEEIEQEIRKAVCQLLILPKIKEFNLYKKLIQYQIKKDRILFIHDPSPDGNKVNSSWQHNRLGQLIYKYKPTMYQNRQIYETFRAIDRGESCGILNPRAIGTPHQIFNLCKLSYKTCQAHNPMV